MKRAPHVPKLAGFWGRPSARLIDRLATERSEILSLLVDEPSIGVLLLDRDGRVLRANAMLARMADRKPDRLRGALGASLFHADDQARVARAFARAIAQRGEPCGFPARLAGSAARDPTHQVFVTYAAVHEPAGTVSGLLARLTDVSERQRLQAALAQARQVQAIGQLAGGLAHDFNNLLAAISGAVELAQARKQPDAATAEDLRQIAAAAARGAALVRQVLALGREQVLSPRPVAVNEVVRGAAELIRRLIGRSGAIDLGLDLCEPDRVIRADPAQLDRAIVNLAINARDAMTGGGRLILRTGRRTLYEPLSRGAQTIPPGRYVTIEVADTGTGIAGADLPRVLDPFFTTKRDRGGTGLGLSVVDGIARQSGGFVEVESEVGRGTCVRIHLPRQDASALPTPPADAVLPPQPCIPAAQRTVLVVDAEDPVRRVARLAFERDGWMVLSADCAAAALELIRAGAARGRPDLIVSDVVMPGMNGPDFVRQVREEFGPIPAILVSGYADSAAREQLKLGAVAFLPKPYVLRELIELAGRLLAEFQARGWA